MMPDGGAFVLEVDALSCGYGGGAVVEGLSFALRAGETCALLGPNGVGKTTVFESILGHIPLLGGSVFVDGRDVSSLPRRELARLVGYVPQAHTPPFLYTVVEMVEMGRAAHVPIASSPSRKDRQRALEALNEMGIAQLHDKPYTQISGGERQLALIARALCQQPRLLIMDEPCANLDFGNKVRVLDCVNSLGKAGIAVLMTTHDPDHAFAAASTVVAIVNSDDFVIGPPSDVLDDELLGRLYGVSVHVGDVVTASGSVTVAVSPPT